MRPLIIPASRLLPGLTLYPHINDTNSEILPPKSAFFRSKTDFLRQHFGDLEHCPPLYSRLSPKKRPFNRSSMTSTQ